MKLPVSPKQHLMVCLSLVLLLSLAGCRAAESSPVASTNTPPVARATETIPPQPTPSPTASPVPSLTPSLTPTSLPSPTATPPQPSAPLGGIELHSLTEQGGLALLGDTQTHWIRYNALRWNEIEAVEGTRNWDLTAGMAQGFANAAQQGYQTILVIHRSPAWALATPEVPCGPIREDKLQAFADFVAEAVARFSVPPYNIRYWELGNEPDVPYAYAWAEAPFGCWGDIESPYFGGEYYAEMLKIVYPRIKAIDPQAEVLVGGLLLDCNPLDPPETAPGSGIFQECKAARFLEGIFQNGGGDYFDGISFHAYDYAGLELGRYGNGNWNSTWNETGPSLVAKVGYLRSLLAAYGQSEKYLINTEIALLCGDGTEARCREETFALTKAYFLAQAYTIAWAEQLQGNIWYSINGWRGSGLVDQQMRPNLAFTAYRFNLELLAGSYPLGKVTQYPQIMGYQFQGVEQQIWVLWALSADPQTIQLPALPAQAYDVFGNPLEAGETLEVTVSPVYLVWE